MILYKGVQPCARILRGSCVKILKMFVFYRCLYMLLSCQILQNVFLPEVLMSRQFFFHDKASSCCLSSENVQSDLVLFPYLLLFASLSYVRQSLQQVP